jgi:hypothetical protein
MGRRDVGGTTAKAFTAFGGQGRMLPALALGRDNLETKIRVEDFLTLIEVEASKLCDGFAQMHASGSR